MAKRRDKTIVELDNLKKDFKLSPCEKETVIQFDMESDIASVYSATPGIIAKLDKLGYELVSEDTIGGQVMAKTYRCNKKLISFRNPERKPRVKKEKKNVLI
jgi:uncharacterized linocin/CFP29 family protein